jgi:HEAT repeat protein
MRMRVWQTTTLVAGVLALGAIAIAAAPQRPASANVLSEHHLEALDGMSPQQQAELLLERAINHYRGATAEIAARAPRWRGKITLGERLNRLFITSINSDDLAVRVAGIEVDIAARNLITDPSTVDRLEETARTGAQGPRVNAMWDLALIGNRGVEPDRVFEIVMASLHDENHNIRYWAVESLAYLAVDAAIEPLLEMFHDDPSPTIRERAACSLAQSGMFSATQRRKAIPRLLDFADDSALDDQTRSWVFQALRDITGESLPRDAHAWREWYRRSRGPAER